MPRRRAAGYQNPATQAKFAISGGKLTQQ